MHDDPVDACCAGWIREGADVAVERAARCHGAGEVSETECGDVGDGALIVHLPGADKVEYLRQLAVGVGANLEKRRHHNNAAGIIKRLFERVEVAVIVNKLQLERIARAIDGVLRAGGVVERQTEVDRGEDVLLQWRHHGARNVRRRCGCVWYDGYSKAAVDEGDGHRAGRVEDVKRQDVCERNGSRQIDGRLAIGAALGVCGAPLRRRCCASDECEREE